MSGMRDGVCAPATQGPSSVHCGLVPFIVTILDGDGEGPSLRDDLSGEGRSGRAGELDVEILAEHARVAGDEHRLEVAGARLHEVAAAARLLLDEDLVPLAELVHVRRARHAAQRLD